MDVRAAPERARVWVEAVNAIIAYDVGDLDVGMVVNALIGVTRHPINFQFWFLSDLLLTILLSPLIAFALTRAPAITLLGLFFVWIGDFSPGIFFRTDVLFFFALGDFFRFHDLRLPAIGGRAVWLLVAAFLVAAALRAAAPALVNLSDPLVAGTVDVLTRLMRLRGLPTAVISRLTPKLYAILSGGRAGVFGTSLRAGPRPG